MSVKIIAEAGINHNGNLSILFALADMAKRAGCDYIKIQKREIDWCYSREDLDSPCESPWGTTIEHKVRGRELTWEQIEEFDAYCTKIELPWFASCFDLYSLRQLHKRYPNRPFNKLASAMAPWMPFVREVAAQGKLTLISTGLLEDDALYRVAEVFERFKCPYIVNHCVALYPCPQERLNLEAVDRLNSYGFTYPTNEQSNYARKTGRDPAYSYCEGIGYSGHETGVLPSVIAVQLGAQYIERHITLDRTMYGSDQAASLERQGLERLVRDIRSLDVIIGNGVRKLRGDEKKPVTFRRSE